MESHLHILPLGLFPSCFYLFGLSISLIHTYIYVGQREVIDKTLDWRHEYIFDSSAIGSF